LEVNIGTDEITKLSTFIYDSFQNKEINLKFLLMRDYLTGEFESKTILSYKGLPLEIFLRSFIMNVLPTVILNSKKGFR